MRPGAKKSIVWNYFTKNENDKSATCNLCKKIIKHFGGTTNLNQHLQRIHPIVLAESKQPPRESENENNTNTENTFFDISTPSTSSSKTPAENEQTIAEPGPSSLISNKRKIQPEKRASKQLKLFGVKLRNGLSEPEIEKIDSKLLIMITKDYQPLSIVENKGFLEYSRQLQPLYQPPSRKRLSYEILPKQYTESVSALKAVLHNVKNIAITTDIWTSDSTRAYTTVTAHFVSDNKLCARVLATKEILGSHTGEHIAEVLTTILNDWNIFNKIVTVVSDNAANVKKAIKEHLQKHHHPCIAHTLNLSVTDALSDNKKLSQILKKCRALVGHFKYSALASDKLRAVQQQMNLPILKVKQDVPTRWNSCFLMIQRLSQIKDPLCVAVTNLQKSPEFLDADEWKVLDDCIDVLKSANDLTNILSAENYPTISLIIPLIRGFQFTLKNVNTQTEVGEILRKKLLDTVTRRLGTFELDKIVAKACFLDPRFKKIAFGSEENANNAQEWVTEELNQLAAFRQNQITLDQPPEITPETQKYDTDIWSNFDKKLSEVKTSSTPASMVVLMITQYLEMPPLDRKNNPLEFWSKHKCILPELYELAVKYLCVPSTSVPSERVFSKTGQLTNSRRNKLSPKNLDQIVFLNSQF